jgi:hypothetical protein
LSTIDKERLAEAAEDLLLGLREREFLMPDAAYLLQDHSVMEVLDDALNRRIESPTLFGIDRWLLESNLMSDLVLVEKLLRFARLVQGRSES